MHPQTDDVSSSHRDVARRQPLVSIMVPVFNQEEFISEALESILTQSYTEIEVIVADDASTDRTAEIVQAYCARHPEKVRLIKSEKNLGVTANCRRLISLIRGEYVCWFAGDDVMHSHKIATQVEALEQKPDAVLCYHDCAVFDSSSGKILFSYNGVSGHEPFGGDVFRLLLLHRCFICGISAMIRTSAMPAEGHDARIPTASDWHLFISVASKGRAIYLPEVLASYRRHAKNITNRPPSHRDEEITYELAEREWPHAKSTVNAGRAKLYCIYAVKHIARGDLRAALSLILKLTQHLLRSPGSLPLLAASLAREIAWPHRGKIRYKG